MVSSYVHHLAGVYSQETSSELGIHYVIEQMSEQFVKAGRAHQNRKRKAWSYTYSHVLPSLQEKAAKRSGEALFSNKKDG